MAKIKIIPIELPFLPTLASYVWDKFRKNSLMRAVWPDLSDILLIFPSQRNKFYFRRYLLKASGKPGIIPPTMLTVKELSNLLFERLGGKKGKKLEKLERNLILKYVVDSLKIEFWKDLDFLKFISVGDKLLSFFDELQKADIILDNIEELKEKLHFPQKYVENELVIIRRIFDEYRRVLQESGYTDTEYEYALIKKEFKAEMLEDFKYIFISGLLAPARVEGTIIKKILSNLPSELILHSKKEEIKDDLTTPFYNHNRLILFLGKSVEEIVVIGEQSSVIGKNQHPITPQSYQKSNIKNQISNMGRGLPFKQSTIYNLQSAVHITRLKSQIQEVLYIKEILKKLISIYEPHRIAVVLADESLASPIKVAIEKAGYNCNLSMGLPFSRNLLYSFLSLLRDAVKKNFHYEEFFAFIRHPLLKNAKLDGEDARAIIYALEKEMIGKNRIFFRFDDFRDEEYRSLINMIKKFTDTITVRQSLRPEHFVPRLNTEGLRPRGSPKTDNTSFSLYMKGIEELLSQLLSSNPEFLKSGILGIKEFLDETHKLSNLIIREDIFPTGMEKLDFILRVLKDETYSIEGNPFKGVQLIGVLEARNLDFDCVILPSMNEGIFPKRSEKDLFVPALLRKEAELPYDKERENLFYYYFTQLVAGKKEIFISYVEKEDRDVCSRFVSFVCDKGIEIKESSLLFEKEKTEKKEIVPKDGVLIKKLEKMKYSPSSLRIYRKCPYHFYLKYILEIGEPEKIVEEAGPIEWGNIIHRALQKFYSVDFPSHFTRDNLHNAERILYFRMKETLREILGRPKASSLFDLEVYKGYIKRFLYEDLERFEEGYRVQYVEKKLEEYELHIDGRKIKLKGKTDRIDTLDGKYYIIDYKTGQSVNKRLYSVGEAFTEFQLPMYALIFSKKDFEDIGGLLYYYISKNSVGPEDIMEEGYIPAFRDEILIPTIRELIDPKTPWYRTNDESRCRTCAYKEFCGR